jgi:hypothetical protein
MTSGRHYFQDKKIRPLPEDLSDGSDRSEEDCPFDLHSQFYQLSLRDM